MQHLSLHPQPRRAESSEPIGARPTSPTAQSPTTTPSTGRARPTPVAYSIATARTARRPQVQTRTHAARRRATRFHNWNKLASHKLRRTGLLVRGRLANVCASAAMKARPGTSLHRRPATRLRRLQALRLRLAYQRVPFRVNQRVDGKIDIEVRPVQMMRTGQLNPADLLDRGLLEPWEVLERYEQLLFAYEQPKAMGRHVRDFNRGSASPKRCGFHVRAPQRVPALLRAAWP